MQSVKCVPLIMAPVKLAFLRRHFSKPVFSNSEFLKLTPVKSQKRNILPDKLVSSNLQEARWNFLAGRLFALWRFSKTQFCIKAPEKSQLVNLTAIKFRLLNLLSGKEQSEKPVLSQLIEERSQALNVQLLKVVNLRLIFGKEQAENWQSEKCSPRTSFSSKFLFL